MGFIDQYRSAADLPHLLKVFPLPGALLLPHAELPLNIFEPRYLAMVSDALAGDRLIGMIQPDIEDADLSGSPALKQVGCAGRIRRSWPIREGVAGSGSTSPTPSRSSPAPSSSPMT